MHWFTRVKTAVVVACVSVTIAACSDSPTAPQGNEVQSKVRAYGGSYSWEEGYWCELQDYYVDSHYKGTDLLCSPDPGLNGEIYLTLGGGLEDVNCVGACLAFNEVGGAYYGGPAAPTLPAELPTLVEISLCISSPAECGVVYGARDIAFEWTRANAPPGAGYNDIWDARRHALWSGLMTINMPGGANSAAIWGNAHEEWDGNPAGEKCMDLHNNQVGRQLADSIMQNSSIPAAARRDELQWAIMHSPNLRSSPGC